jgi:hypothetical protein
MYTTRTSNNHMAAILTVLALFFTLGYTASLKAQMSPPTMPDLTKKLQSFVGTWEGTGTMAMGDMKHDVKITHVSTSTVDGWGVAIAETNEIDGMPTYHGSNMFGYDAGTGLTHLYTVSNYGECHDHKGKWSDENNLKLQHDGMMDGKPMTEVIDITLDGPDQYHFTGTTTVDGKVVNTFTGNMKKQK